MKTFAAGQAWYQGRPAKYWMGSVSYEWDTKKLVFHVQTETLIGTGSVYDYTSRSEEVKSSEGVDKVINDMKWLENHYKKVYGE